MKSAVIVLGAAATLVWAVAATSPGSSPAASATPARALAGKPAVLSHYGHIRSLTRKGARYELRFDPALWLSGVTANKAAVADGVIRPGEAVPNDYYIRDEGRRVLTFLVPARAKASVVTLASGSIRSTRVPVSELAQIVKGKNPRGRALMDRRNQFGYWIRVAIDSVPSLDQQYQP